MTEHPSNSHERLELFLDGMLEGEELQAFQAELERSPDLRAQLVIQERINDALLRTFPVQEVPMPAVAGVIEDDEAEARLSSRWLKQALVAASVLIAGAIGAYFLFFSTQRAEFDQPGEVYTKIVASGFEPREVCTSEEAFIAWMDRKFDQPLVVPTDAPGIELVGWDYKRIMTPRTGILLARVDGEEVLVLVELRENSVRLGDQPEQDLRVFRRNIGRVSLFEVTPLDEPRLLPLAKDPS